jgi:ABC-type transporter Mla MlaB component
VLKIADMSTSAEHALYALAGEITAEQIPRLEELARRCLKAGKKLALDLTWVWRVDREAAAFFRSGPGRDVALVGVPEGLIEWIENDAGSEDA